jgi:hypothetical protein
MLLLTFASPALGQSSSQTLTFDDLGLGGGTATSGTYAPGSTFGFDVVLTFDGYNCRGFAFWLETNAAFGPFLAVTGVAYSSAFPHPIETRPNPALFLSTTGASPGYLTEVRDLGSLTDTLTVPPDTYFVGHISFSIAAGAPPGTYDLALATVSPRNSATISFDGKNSAGHDLPEAHYAVTVVPEPSGVVLLVGGAISLVGLGSRHQVRRNQLGRLLGS